MRFGGFISFLLLLATIAYNQDSTIVNVRPRTDSLSSSPADTISKAAKPAHWDSAASLDKMVVTGTRTPRSIKDNPAAVFVVTEGADRSVAREQRERHPALPAGAAGAAVGGHGRRGPHEHQPARRAGRHRRSARTLILVDGIPTNAAGTPFLILNEVPLESIERVEVVEGPYSGLYGPNAFGGVVNIITRNPSPGIHGSVSGGGYLGFYDVDGEGSVSLGRFSLLVNAAARGIDNWTGRDSVDHFWVGSDSAGHPIAHHDRITNSNNYGYYDRRIFGKLGYALSSRATLTLQARYFDSDLGFGTTEYGNPPSNISTLGQKFLIGPSLKMNISPAFDLHVAAYYDGLLGTFYSQGVERTDSTLDTAGSVWKTQSNDVDLDAQAVLKLGGHNTATIGFDILDNMINFGPRRNPATDSLMYDPNAPDSLSDSANKSMINGGVYVQDEMRYGRFVGIAGARLDYNSVFGAAICPKLGIVYKQNDMFRLKFSAGRAFRAPSLGELYLPDMPINSGTTLVSNPHLVPEYIWTVDGGPEFDFLRMMNVRIAGFYNYMNDLITQEVINQYYQQFLQNALLSHKNIENAWSAGAEASLQFRLPKWGMFFFNYTFTESENEQMHGPLDYIPEHAFNVGVYFGKAFGPVTVSGSILEDFVGSREYLDFQEAALYPLPSNPQDISPAYVTLPSYFRTDASVKIAYRMVWIGIEGLNLTNATIMEEAGTFAPPRFVWGRVGVKF